MASRSSFLARHGWLLWTGPTLTAVVCATGRLSGHYGPKVCWAALTMALGFALLPFVRREDDGERPVLTLTPLGLFWGLYLAWALLSLTWSPAPAVGLERWEACLLPTAAYFLARHSRFWESRAFWFFFCVLFGAEALLGFLEYVSFGSAKARAAAWLPAALASPFNGALDALKSAVGALPGTSVPRATLGHRNYVAFYCMVALPFAVWSYFRARGWRQALVPGAALALGILFLALSRVRGAWVGTVLAAGAALAAGGAAMLWRRPRHVAALAVAGLVALAVAQLAQPSREFQNYGYVHKVTLWRTMLHLFDDNGRFAMWFEALGHSNPWLGTGFGNSPIVISPWSVDGHIKALNWELHNDYLQALMDLGGAGAVLFALAVGAAVLTAWRAAKGEATGTEPEEANNRAAAKGSPVALASLAALAGTAFMLGTTFLAQLVSTQVWLAGVLAIAASRPAALRALWRRALPRFAPPALCALAAIWLFTLAFRAWESTQADRRMVEALNSIPPILSDESRPAAERQEAARAVLRATAHEVLPRARFDANMIHIQCFEMAKASCELGALETARIFGERAVRLHPADTDTLGALAQIYIYAKQPREAVARLEQIVHWYGHDPYTETPERLAQLYEQLGQPAKAHATRLEAEANRVGTPEHPLPADGARDVPRKIDFAWSACNAALSYDVFVWQQGTPEPTEPLLKGLRANEAHPQPLAPAGTVCCWRVRAVGRYRSEKSPIWQFTTTAAPEP